MKIIIDHKSPVPLHAQVEQLLREMIDSYEYKNNKLLLPNEVMLARQLGISRNTVRQAINKLVYEGLLIRKKGVGTWVVDRSVQTKINNWFSFSQEMKNLGIKIRNFDLSICWVESDERVATFFNIEKTKKILKLIRVRGREEFPFVYFISFFNPRIGLTENEDFSLPLYDILKKKYSIVVKVSKEEISAQLATEEIAKKLDITVGAPILKRKRMVFDPGGHPVEYNIGYYRADSFVYTIESEREI